MITTGTLNIPNNIILSILIWVNPDLFLGADQVRSLSPGS